MIENPVKRALQAGQTVYGTMIGDSRTPAVVQVLKNSGFDFFILDMEHGPFDLQTAADMMLMARMAGIVPLVRVPDDAYPWITRVLDAGALGVMVPRVRSREQVQAIVRTMKYPPVGDRGMAAGRGNTMYRPVKMAEYAVQANQETMLITQIETREAIADIDGILAVPGVDAALIGPNDLAMALDVGEVGHSKVTAAIQKTVDAAAKHKIPSGIHTRDMAAIKMWRDKGMRLLMYSTDFALMASAATAAVSELKGK